MSVLKYCVRVMFGVLSAVIWSVMAVVLLSMLLVFFLYETLLMKYMDLLYVWAHDIK